MRKPLAYIETTITAQDTLTAPAAYTDGSRDQENGSDAPAGEAREREFAELVRYLVWASLALALLALA